jgi:hypothetical protein
LRFTSDGVVKLVIMFVITFDSLLFMKKMFGFQVKAGGQSGLGDATSIAPGGAGTFAQGARSHPTCKEKLERGQCIEMALLK